ncbi:MAG: methionyl-tRNA formyltransferase [Roseicyclus sp.]|uniref:methionyl-tRNA formyltransferase n=1 Tax=Roseicyclus sp. TaxID=1914329 RepID=UPI003A84F135
MRIALLGRTRWLIDAAEMLRRDGHDIVSVVTAREEPFYQCGPAEFEALAARSGADFLGVASLGDPSVLHRLVAARPELAVSINWPVVVDAAVIGLFQYGVVNAHCGDLPRYRGNACPNWAIINGEERIGLCAHLMEAGALDAGPVLLRDYMPVTEDTYIGDVYFWLDRRIPTLIAEAISGLAEGALWPSPQPDDAALALRCYPRRPSDGRIDWHQSVTAIHRLVRASSRPFSGAFASLEDGRRLTIWRARPFHSVTPFCAVPGQVMLRANGDPVIACGTGALVLEEVEVEGMEGGDHRSVVGRSLRMRLT